MDKDISVTLKVWRQRGPKEKGQFETYKIEKIIKTSRTNDSSHSSGSDFPD